MESKEVRIVVPAKTIITLVLTLLGLWIFYQVREVALVFLIVVAITIAFSPIIKSWETYMPRTLAIVCLYVLIILGVLLIAALIFPPLISQLSDFLDYAQNQFAASGYTNNITFNTLRDNVLLLNQGRGLEAIGQLFNQFQGSLGAVYSHTVSFIGSVFGIITVFITSFYLLLEEGNSGRFLSRLFPDVGEKRIQDIKDKISLKMSGWLRGQLLLMVLVGAADGIALAILGVPYALVLGLWAGLTELLPYVGPIIGAIPGAIIAFTTLGVVKGFIAIGIYVLVQQLESQFLVPKIMGKALGLSPVAIIFSLLVGGKLLGLLGVLLAIPVAAAVSVIFEERRRPS